MKNKIMVCGFLFILAFFPIFGIVLKDEDKSFEERRTLEKFPEFSINNVLEGKYFKNLNKYFTDHFPLRTDLRKLKGTIIKHSYDLVDDSITIVNDKHIFNVKANLNKKSIKHLTDLINSINTNNLKSNKVYISIIPDKNYYLNDSNIPRLDYDTLIKEVNNNLPDSFKYIDLRDTLSLDSYYYTDIHWRQDKLSPVINKLADTMKFKPYEGKYTKHTYKPFYGALYGRVTNSLEADTITYLSNKELDNIKVYNFEKQRYEKIYNEDYLHHLDAYDIYLSGATPLLVLENENVKNKKELVIFRDSFGSSITPLLANSYSKITVIDLRYISSTMLDKIELIDFNKKQDVLFLYSTPVINSSFALK